MDFSEIRPGLYQGSRIERDELHLLKDNDIRAIIDLQGGFDDSLLAWEIHGYLYFHFLDLPVLPDRERLWNAVRWGYNSWKAGDTLLVHCTMGKNRSGLVVGCILWLDGMEGSEIIPWIRGRRPGALTNPAFVHYLEVLPKHHAKGDL